MLSGCFNCLALTTILKIHLTGQRSGLALSDDKVIVWPFFWRFFWMCQVILTESAMLKEKSSIIFSWHLDLSKKTKSSSAVNDFMTWRPNGYGWWLTFDWVICVYSLTWGPMYQPRVTILERTLWSNLALLDSHADRWISVKMTLSSVACCMAMFSSFVMLLMTTPALLFLLL
jgi:hypothetical protein